nr:hypothetical protein [Alicyclobacillus macrosporangiidus]
MTREAVKTLNVKEEWVTVLFDEYDREVGRRAVSCIP